MKSDGGPWHTDSWVRRALEGSGVLDADLVGQKAPFANPTILVQLIEWADKLLTE